jgi:hypothetical protein
MARRSPLVATYPAIVARVSLACVLGSAAAWAVESPPDPAQKLQLTLTEIELESIIKRYQESLGLSQLISLEEVTVKAFVVPLKMRDSTQDAWGGIAAPFWALLHPTQSWRILLPVPPKEPAPDTSDQGQ